MEIRSAIERIEIYTKASPASIRCLAENSYIKSAAKGALLFEDKCDIETVYSITSGLASIYKISSGGEKKVIFICGADSTLNVEIVNGLPSSVSCEILEDAMIICTPVSVLIQAMENDFSLSKAVIDSMSKRIRRLYRQLKNTPASVRGDRRLAAKLWKLSLDHGIPVENGTLIDLNISITYLADMLGAKRETVSRQMRTLIDFGLITQTNGRIIVTDKSKLSEYFKRL